MLSTKRLEKYNLRGGEKSLLPPPVSTKLELPEAGDYLTGHGIRAQSGDQAEQGDARVPEFDGLGARLFHRYRVIWGRLNLLLYLSTQISRSRKDGI
jgi:hypothetical protein